MFEMHASISKVLVGQLSDGLQVLLDLDSVIKFAKTIKKRFWNEPALGARAGAGAGTGCAYSNTGKFVSATNLETLLKCHVSTV